MDDLSIGLRAQDFHEGLREVGAFGPKEAYFEKTLRIGKAAVLAMHLRGLLYVDDYRALTFAAAQLGIGGSELPVILHELEEIDFVRMKRARGEIERVDLRIPVFRDGYEELGARLKALNPSEIEQAGLAVLQDLIQVPQKEADLIQSLGMGSAEYSILRDVMRDGQLLQVETVSGERIVYTPLTVDNDPLAYLRWYDRFPSQVSAALNILIQNQGLSISSPSVSSNPALNEAIQTGVFMPVEVDGATGMQRFLFAPRGGLMPEERVVLDKARAILACVRYGETFAAGRKILYPRLILERLRDYKRFKHGHPDLLTQYGLLALKGIGHPIDEGRGRWNFKILDTEDNMKALAIAIDMLEIGETPTAKIDLEAQNAILSPGGYLGPLPTRTRLAGSIKSSAQTRAEIIKQISAIGRGMKT